MHLILNFIFILALQAVGHAFAQPPFPAKGELKYAQLQTLAFGGEQRTFLIDASSSAQSTGVHGPALVVLLHGGTQTAQDVWTQTSLPTLARERGFIIVAPQGTNKQWNDGRATTLSGVKSGTDDVGFLLNLIQKVVAQYKVDSAAVFMVGASNGGIMTMRFACEQASVLGAASNVISNLPLKLGARCQPTKPLPWLSMNGTLDKIMPFHGSLSEPALLSAEATFNFWAKRDTSHRSCFIALQGAGHQWANPSEAASRRLVVRLLGEPNWELDSGLVIWDFFAKTLTPP